MGYLISTLTRSNLKIGEREDPIMYGQNIITETLLNYKSNNENYFVKDDVYFNEIPEHTIYKSG
jgi:hypothetical protein